MAPNYPGTESGFFSKQYVNEIYIPSSLLLVGCAICKADWLLYAAALAILLSSYKLYGMRKASQCANFYW